MHCHTALAPAEPARGVLDLFEFGMFSGDLGRHKDNLKSCSSVLAVIWRRIMNSQSGMNAALMTSISCQRDISFPKM